MITNGFSSFYITEKYKYKKGGKYMHDRKEDDICYAGQERQELIHS
jgi:4-hydroxy-3-methylbut-2-enyl diphosphate reductase IspH